jgi:glycosyltransferase involved in cell wall biosynthesis
MNILYINHYAGSIYHGMEYRPYYLAREWIKQGHQVTIIASNLSHLRQKNIKLDSKQNYITQYIDGIRYVWCKTTPYQQNGMKRVINILSFLFQLWRLRKQIIQDKPDIIIASSTYPFDMWLASYYANIYQAKLIYEVHDLWPLTPIEVGGMSPYHPFIMAMQSAENFAYRRADKVVSLLVNASSYMQQHGMHSDKFVPIPNGVVVSDWLNATQDLPIEHNSCLTNLREQQQFIIGYAGSMGDSNALDYLLDALKLLAESNLHVVMVGDGVRRSDLENRIKQEQIQHITILPAINKLQIPAFLKQCDALYIGWHKLAIYRFGISPNKLFDYMLAAKPILHSVTAGNDLVAEANCGISVGAEDSQAIATAMLKLSQLDTSERDLLGQNGKNFVLTNYDYAILAEKFLHQI